MHTSAVAAARPTRSLWKKERISVTAEYPGTQCAARVYKLATEGKAKSELLSVTAEILYRKLPIARTTTSHPRTMAVTLHRFSVLSVPQTEV